MPAFLFPSPFSLCSPFCSFFLAHCTLPQTSLNLLLDVLFPTFVEYVIITFKYVFAPMGRFQLELIYLFFHRPSIKKLLFLSCRPFVVITTLSTGLVGVEVNSVSWLGQETEVTSTPTRPVDNVVITMKDLQDRNNCFMEGRW